MIYLFPHLPKTGGAALFENVESSLPKGKSLRLNYTQQQFYYDPRTGEKLFHESENDFWHLMRSLSEEEKGRIEFASGHDLPYGLHEYFPQKARYFTFVREPVARTLSLYNYQRTQYEILKKMKEMDESHRRLQIYNARWFLIDGKIPSFEEWLELAYDGDYLFYWTMARTLRHHNYWEDFEKKFYFVGLTETLNEDEYFLYHEMGIRRFWANRNASFPYIRKIDRKLKEKIREKNREDLILYEKAKKMNAAFKAKRQDWARIVWHIKWRKRSSFIQEKVNVRSSVKGILVYALNLFFRKRSAPLPENPRRILVCNNASFGDVVISSCVLPALKRRYPDCEIGFLSSANTADVMKGHPLVTRLHTLNHWFGTRGFKWMGAFVRHWIDFYRKSKEIKKCQYDLAIDLYPHFLLSVIPLLWRAKIPVRIGRFIDGYTNLLTHVVPSDSPVYMGQNHLNLLRNIGIEGNESPFPHYFSRGPFSLKDYIVVHMGTANPMKEWEIEKWVEVVQKWMEKGETVVLTGKGAREQVHCEKVAKETGCVNFCNRLSWAEFVSAIQNAKLLISVDSASIHLASAEQIPCVALFAEKSPMAIWKPPYSSCKAMMKSVKAEEVVRVGEELLCDVYGCC